MPDVTIIRGGHNLAYGPAGSDRAWSPRFSNLPAGAVRGAVAAVISADITAAGLGADRLENLRELSRALEETGERGEFTLEDSSGFYWKVSIR